VVLVSRDGSGAPRARGVGTVFGDLVVASPQAVETAQTALFADGREVRVQRERIEAALGAVRLAEPESVSAVTRTWREGEDVTVVAVSDVSPSVVILPGAVAPGAPGRDAAFTVELQRALSEDVTVNGSPILAGAEVVGFAAPTATSTSLDAYGADVLERVLGAPPPVREPAVKAAPTQPPPAPSASAFDLAGGTSADLVDPTTGIPLDRDRLGLATDVTMFATLIADTATPMPLSIGLFGEWGSGKSTFMAMLRGRIAELARSNDPRYHREIVQIGFNAWHYADTNLWASLGDEIFEQLAGPRPDDGDARRAELRAALAERLQRRRELEAAASRAQAETERLTSALAYASSQRRVSAGTLAKAALQAPELRGRLAKAFDRLGVGEDGERERLLTDQLELTRDDVDVVRGAASPWVWLAGLAVVAAVVVAVMLAWDALAGLVAAIPAVLAVLVAIEARLRSGARLLHQVADGVRRGQAEQVAGHVRDLREAETNERVVRAQLDEAVQQAGELRKELADLEPGRRLYSFVAERAASDAYRGQLGLISTIRKDFEQLIALMREWREKGGDAPRPIDRIVLYIDDLDRCSPAQVVQVLQAVHLLLALDLFVVVVGVDPRWLMHSLQQEYRSMWATTPQDYLEKIFNIPFALPGMTPSSFAGLIGSLAETEEAPAAGPAPAAADPGAVRGRAEPAIAVPESGSEVAALHEGAPPVPRRPLSGDELAMLSALAPLVRTPREAKRLMNLYRMLRATRDLSPASRFLGDETSPGEYQAVVILLGVLSGRPELLPRLLADLAAGPAERSWADVAAGLEPRLADGLRDASALVTLPDLSAFGTWAPRIARYSFVLSATAAIPRAGDGRAERAPAASGPTDPSRHRS
jgi:hypothetical protein